MNDRSDIKESTKLKLIAALKDAGKPQSPDNWAKAAGVGRATIFRYLPFIKEEGWLKETMGPRRSVLYSVKANRAVLPVGQIPEDAKASALRVDKKLMPEILFGALTAVNNELPVTGSMLKMTNYFRVVAGLYIEVSRAQSGEMVDKEKLAQYRSAINDLRQQFEKTLSVLNTMLVTPELWDYRTLSGYLSGTFDVQQLAQWTEAANDNIDLVQHILKSLQTQSDYVVTDSAITFDLSSD